MVLFKESEVEGKIREYLRGKDFTVEERTGVHGTDIIATKNGQKYCIEVQGNTLSSTQKYTHYLRAIGQLVLRMNEHPNSIFILGLPEDDYYNKKLKDSSIGLGKLGIKVWKVNEKSEINEI